MVETHIIVPIVCTFQGVRERFIFSQPGKYFLRWGFWDKQKLAHDRVQFVHEVQALPSKDEGSTFLAGLARKNLDLATAPTQLLRGQHDRALLVVNSWLRCARNPESIQGAFPSELLVTQWADASWELAKEFPNSSYAPLAAFFAGATYTMLLSESAEAKNLGATEAKDSLLYQKAHHALDFSTRSNNAYLRPRGLIQQGLLHVRLADFAEADKIINEIEADQIANVTMGQALDALGDNLARLKRRLHPEK